MVKMAESIQRGRMVKFVKRANVIIESSVVPRTAFVEPEFIKTRFVQMKM